MRLAKYVPDIIPIEAARIERFRACLITSLYNAIVVAEFAILSRLIDKAKKLEVGTRKTKLKENRGSSLQGRLRVVKEGWRKP